MKLQLALKCLQRKVQQNSCEMISTYGYIVWACMTEIVVFMIENTPGVRQFSPDYASIVAQNELGKFL